MEPKFPEPYCEHSPNSAHYFDVLGGGICICRFCDRAKWLPTDIQDAIGFTIRIRTIGLDKAYQQLLRHRYEVRLILEKLEKTRLSKSLGKERKESLGV